MKYIITEQQFENTIKKFNKDDVDRGELGRAIEELVIHFMNGKLCDIVAFKQNSFYIVLVLTSNRYGYDFQYKIAEYIKTYLGDDIYVDVYMQDSPDCEKMEN